MKTFGRFAVPTETLQLIVHEHASTAREAQGLAGVPEHTQSQTSLYRRNTATEQIQQEQLDSHREKRKL